MPNTLYLAPNLDSALHHLTRAINDVRQDQPFAPVTILLPDIASSMAMRKQIGDTMAVRLFQFYTFGQMILDTAGTATYQLNDLSVRRLVGQVLAGMADEGRLTSFATVWQTPGFQQVLLEWLREMKSQGIAPEAVAAHAQQSGQERDRQLAEFYTRYQDFMHRCACSDPDGLLWLATEELENTPALPVDQQLFAALGFDQFNPLQIRILRAFAGHCPDFRVYLPWDGHRPAGSLALTRLALTRRLLEEALSPGIQPVEPNGAVERILDHLQRHIFEPAPRPAAQPNGLPSPPRPAAQPNGLPSPPRLPVSASPRRRNEVPAVTPSPPLQLVAAPSREAEARWALKAIKRLLLDGAAPDQIALLAPNPGAYQRVVEATADEYGVPVQAERRLRNNPAIATLLNLLVLAPEFPWRETMDALRSPYLRRAWLTTEQVDQIDRLSRERPVLGGRDQWRFALTPIRRTGTAGRPLTPLDAAAEAQIEDEDLGPPRLASLLEPEALAAIERGLMAFFDLLTPPLTATYRGFTLWLQRAILGLFPEEEEEDPRATLSQRGFRATPGINPRATVATSSRKRRMNPARKIPAIDPRSPQYRLRKAPFMERRLAARGFIPGRAKPDGQRRGFIPGSLTISVSASPRPRDEVPAVSPSLFLAACCASGPYARRDTQVLALVTRTLRALVEASERVNPDGEEMFSWADYRADLLRVLPGQALPADPLQPGVRFAALETGRSQVVDHLLVLGLAEGEFPRLPAPDVLYAPDERKSHPLPLSRIRSGEQASLWWQVLSNVRRSLALLRPRLDEKGAPWLPSSYWEAVVEAAKSASPDLTRLDIRMPHPTLIEEIQLPIVSQPALSDAASPAELLLALAERGAVRVPPEVSAPWQASQAAYRLMRQRQGWQPASGFEGVLADPQAVAELAQRYGSQHNWSASRLNRYGNCPYGFFAEAVLGLEERADPAEGFDAMQRGTLLHAVLEKLFNRLTAGGIALAPPNLPEIEALLEECCARVFDRAPERYGFQPGALWAYEQAELRRVLATFIRWEYEQNADSPGFQPYRQELRFGIHGSSLPGSDLPSLPVRSADGFTFLLHGMIDRLDRDAAGRLRLVDYKSGSTTYSKTDIAKGLAFQSPLYALAVEQLLQNAVVAESAYLHLPTREKSGELKFSSSVAANETAREAIEQAALFVQNIRWGIFPILPAKTSFGQNNCSNRCDFSGLCRADRHIISKARRGGLL